MVCNVSGLFLWVDFFARRCKFLYRVVLIRRNERGGEEKRKKERKERLMVDGLDRGCLCKIHNFYERRKMKK